MKIKGRNIPAPEPLEILILREEEVITFKIDPILDWTHFDKVCPEPKPPKVNNISTGTFYKDFKDPKYLQNLSEYNDRLADYYIVKGLLATEEFEWEKVKLDDPTTWKLYQEELKESLTRQEINLLVNAVFTGNLPSQETCKQARKNFTLRDQDQS